MRSWVLALSMFAVAGVAAAQSTGLATSFVSAGPAIHSPDRVVHDMLNAAEVRAADIVIDLGSGDGRIVRAAAKQFGARAVGIEIDPELVSKARILARADGVVGRVSFRIDDLFGTDISEATVVTLYLLPDALEKLKDKLTRELKAGTRVVTHDYPIKGWRPVKYLNYDLPEKIPLSGVPTTIIYVYRVGESDSAAAPAAPLAARPQEEKRDVLALFAAQVPLYSSVRPKTKSGLPIIFPAHARRVSLLVSSEQAREFLARYRADADAGDAVAQLSVGLAYRVGFGVAADHAQANTWMRKAVDAGLSMANIGLAGAYQNGWGVPADPVEATRLLRQAADKGDVVGEITLGDAYRRGIGVPVDNAQAMQWYLKAATKAEAVAAVRIGEMYKDGLGTIKDAAIAVKWYRIAADMGLPAGKTALAYMYQMGDGVPRDEAEAAKWYRQAADQGDIISQYNLGYLYEHGMGVEKSKAEAVSWYRKAAELGYAKAETALGNAYVDGDGVAKDAAEGARWYHRAAKQQEPGGEFGLGRMYRYGLGVRRDDVEAANWYRKSADRGLSWAQYELGVMYRDGAGVAKDAAEAEKWFRKAADQGHELARKTLAAQ